MKCFAAPVLVICMASSSGAEQFRFEMGPQIRNEPLVDLLTYPNASTGQCLFQNDGMRLRSQGTIRRNSATAGVATLFALEGNIDLQLDLDIDELEIPAATDPETAWGQGVCFRMRFAAESPMVFTCGFVGLRRDQRRGIYAHWEPSDSPEESEFAFHPLEVGPAELKNMELRVQRRGNIMHVLAQFGTQSAPQQFLRIKTSAKDIVGCQVWSTRPAGSSGTVDVKFKRLVVQTDRVPSLEGSYASGGWWWTSILGSQVAVIVGLGMLWWKRG